MRTSAKTWLALALVAGGVVACASREMAAVPTAGQVVDAASDAAFEPDQPDLVRCASAKAQPSWIFLGACRTIPVRRPGAVLKLSPYKGDSVLLRLPKNNAVKGARVTLVDATGNKDIRRHAGKAFPLNGKAFLYLQTVNRGRPIALVKAGAVSLVISSSAAYPGTQCGVAVLVAAASDGVDATRWRNLPAVIASPSGKNLVFRIPARAFGAIPRGARFLSVSCSGTPPPAYCSGYQTPGPGTSPNQPLYLTDNSGLGAQVVLYVKTGSNEYLAPSGQLLPISFPAATPAPIPLVCYPGSIGGSGQVFSIPGGSNGLLYVALATPVPGNASPPQPFANVWQHSAYAPSLNPTDPTNVHTPWDFIEYTLPNGGVDVTAEDSIGLPLELKVGSFQTLGVSSAGYQSILNSFMALTTPYKRLLVSSSFNGKTILDRIIAPRDGQAYGMPQDWWFNPAYYAGNPLGYLGYVMGQYQTSSSYLFNLTPVNSGATPIAFDFYCGSSDGVSKFVFTPVANTTTSCPAASVGSTVSVPIVDLQAGASVSCAGLIWGQPYGNGQVGAGSSFVFATYDAFYLWKALVIDFDRGTVLSASSQHPVGTFNTGNGNAPTPPADFAQFFPSGSFNDTYSNLVHTNYDNHQAYSIPYDEPGNLASVYSASAPTPWYVTINAVPTLASALPAPVPTPVASPCAPAPNVRR